MTYLSVTSGINEEDDMFSCPIMYRCISMNVVRMALLEPESLRLLLTKRACDDLPHSKELNTKIMSVSTEQSEEHRTNVT